MMDRMVCDCTRFADEFVANLDYIVISKSTY